MSTGSHTQLMKKKATENPFFQMSSTLNMQQNVSKLTDKPNRETIYSLLDQAWKECKDTIEKRQLFFSILFSFGDISNREHNIFGKKGMRDVDGGGEGMRTVFMYCLEWMSVNTVEQFYRFLPLFGEYYNLGAATMFNSIKTDRWKGTLLDQYKIQVDVDRLTDFIASELKACNDNTLALWAKWLWHVPSPNRIRKFTVTDRGLKSVNKKYGADFKVGETVSRVGEKQPVTIAKDKVILQCIALLSEKMNWSVIVYPGANTQYAGYKEFRTKHMANTEAVMFSTGNILKLDKIQLLQWFDQLPGGARHRTQCHIVSKEGDKLVPKTRWVGKAGNIGELYIAWIAEKEKAQAYVRSLSIEDKEKMAPKELKQLEKMAKVNVGGESLIDAIAALFSGKSTEAELNIKADTLMGLMKLELPVLVCVDISGSMSSNGIRYKDVQFSPKSFAQVLTTLFMLKNPPSDLSDMFIRFDNTMDVIANDVTTEAGGKNRFMAGASTMVQNLVNRTKNFTTNFNSISKWIIARGGTKFNVVADGLKRWVDNGGDFSDQRKEMINRYPVYLIISDGDFNSHSVPAQTILDFQMKMRQWFGWEGVVVIWDVNMATNQKSHFEGLANVVHYIGFNAGIVTQVFSNLHDLDIIDIYTGLQTIHRSNRYQPVQELVI